MKRIEFLTQDDPFYTLPLFAEFLRCYSDAFQITRISCCRIMGGRSRRQLLGELLLLYRPVGFIRLLARRTTAKILSLLPARRGAKRYWSMGQLCRAYGIPLVRIGNPNTDAFVAGLQERSPELLVSVACPYILKARVLNATSAGCINIHHAPLPRYKGMMPTFWQLFHGEREVGVTVHYMNEQVDEGQVLLQETLTVRPDESLDQLIRRSKEHGAHCLARVIRDIGSEQQKVIALRAEEGSYFTFPDADHIREFHRRGFRAI